MDQNSFKVRVLDIVRTIPTGKVMTYGDVARRAGSAKAARAVGMILSKNLDPLIPCHRVIKSNGDPGGYNRGVIEKVKLLKSEKSLG